jgi:hypothetical protein
VGSLCKTGTFLGFLLAEPLDTTVSKELKKALLAYSGPSVKINSLRRHYNPSSEHYHGNAVDLAWCEETIAYLLSEDGKKWLADHKLLMYIEGRPGSKKVKKYTSDPDSSRYVFFNPRATGDHIHLEITES